MQWLLLSRSKLLARDFTTAEFAARKALTASEDARDEVGIIVSRSQVGRVLTYAGKYVEAVEILRVALEHAKGQPALAETVPDLVEHLAISLARGGRFTEALQLAPMARRESEAIIAASRSYLSYSKVLYAAHSEELERAAREIITALSIVKYKDLYVYYGHLAWMLSKQGRMQEATAVRRLTLTLMDSSTSKSERDFHVLKTDIWHAVLAGWKDKRAVTDQGAREADLKASGRAFNEAIRALSDTKEHLAVVANAHAGLGLIAYLRGDMATVERHYRKAIEVIDRSSAPRYHYHLALAGFLEQFGRPSEARAAYEAAWKVGTTDRNRTESQSAVDWDLGAYYQRAGMNREAWPLLSRAKHLAMKELSNPFLSAAQMRAEMAWRRLYFIRFVSAAWSVVPPVSGTD